MGCNASKQEGNVSRSAPGGSKAKGGGIAKPKKSTNGFKSATAAPVPAGGACYLGMFIMFFTRLLSLYFNKFVSWIPFIRSHSQLFVCIIW